MKNTGGGGGGGGGGGDVGGQSGRLSLSSLSAEDNTNANGVNIDEEELPRLAIASLQAREEEIEKKKMEVKHKVEIQLVRAEEQNRRLAQIWEALEVFADPMRKEVAIVRKRIDMANRELKSLAQSCQKKEKDYKEALEALNEKSTEKAQLTSLLTEMVNESEKVRMKKLEELSKIIDYPTAD